MSSYPVRPTCNHTAMGRAFQYVLCPTQSLAKRVSLVTVGYLLLVGALFAAYSVIKNRLSPPVCPNKYPTECNNAILFACMSLQQHPDIKGEPFSTGLYDPLNTHQPVDPQITTLNNLFWDVHFKTFEKALKKFQDNPWNEKEVLAAADALMKVAYTISCRTLEDLQPFTERLKQEKGQERTYAEALTKQDSYQYRTFYMCTNAYHWIRGEAVWNGETIDYPKSPVTAAFAKLFYTKGTLHQSWNQLYNDYCDRVRAYVKEGDLRKADGRHANWTTKDTGTKTFCRVPDTQPT